VRRKIAAPRVDVLAQQRDLANALGGETRDLGHDVTGAAAHLAPANRWDDAVRALRVAPHRDLHPRLEAALAMHRQLACKASVVEAEATPCEPEPTRTAPLAEVRNRTGREGDVDIRRELEQPLALRLRVAAADGDDLVGAAALKSSC